MLRGQRRAGALAQRLGFGGGPVGRSAPDVADAVIASDAAYNALAKLRSGDREVLMLAVAGGLTQADLGLALGCSAKAAGVRLTRARARLTRAMTESGASVPSSAPAGPSTSRVRSSS
ncbi:MAG: hypothetical protein LBK95_08560, partial [Bifidobacteriaceae bacterium]|nr:hypothetical protein [Bifidobacteriaceae bacterium]